MPHHDVLQRFIFDRLPVRGEFIHLKKSFQTIVHQHVYPASVYQLLGEALCVAGLLRALLKFQGRLTVQFRGEGPLKLLLTQCDHRARLRGLIKWEGELSYEALMDAFKKGTLTILLDPGKNKNRYQGIVSWRGPTLAESIEGYFQDSEQLATKIWLAVNEESAVGFLLQAIPSTDRYAEFIEKEFVHQDFERIIQQASLLQKKEMLEMDCEVLLKKLYPHDTIRVFPEESLAFRCTCSRKKGEQAVLLLGQEEAEAELNNNQVVVVTCEFCNKKYVFDRVDVGRIFKNGHSSSQKPLH